MGRKKMNGDETLKHLVWTRVNQAHYTRLEGMLSRSHYRSMSEMLRDIVCEGKVTLYTRDESLSQVMGELTRIRRELNAIGTNINQATRRIHLLAPGEELRDRLADIASDYWRIGEQVNVLFPIISSMAKKWLQS